MQKLFNFSQKSNREQGIALLMVMSSITILTYIIIDFTFETQVNKMRVHNITDRMQARLTAEAGLNLALARIRLYQEARNMYEQSEAIQGMIDLSVLEDSIRNPDFMYPIPIIDRDMDQRTISAINDFNDDSLISGELMVTISSVSGFLNPNNMRVRPLTPEEEELQEEERWGTRERQREDDGPSPQEFTEQTLIETLEDAMEKRREEDDLFDLRYGNLDARLLIKEIKFYINHPDDFQDSERAEIEAMYRANDIRPKHAPLTSLDELYLLEGWDDEIVNLIKDRLTVHEVSVIQVNELTENQLRVLFPEITEFQVEEFFRYRDGDTERNERPRPFQNASEFKELVVNRLSIINEESYEDLISAFESAGLTIGVAGKLFRVRSMASFNRATYNLEAYIDVPIKPLPPLPPREDSRGRNNEDQAPDGDRTQRPDEFIDEEEELSRGQRSDEEEDTRPLEFLPPRAVEIRRI